MKQPINADAPERDETSVLQGRPQPPEQRIQPLQPELPQKSGATMSNVLLGVVVGLLIAAIIGVAILLFNSKDGATTANSASKIENSASKKSGGSTADADDKQKSEGLDVSKVLSEAEDAAKEAEEALKEAQVETLHMKVERLGQKASRQELSASDLNELSVHEANLVKNYIYATYGFAFRGGQEYDKFFREYAWYNPVKGDDFRDNLTTIERINVNALIDRGANGIKYTDF